MTADFSSTQIDLAREPPFALGAVEVEPALGEVVWQGVRETLQPRVMQVLVALGRARGHVLSRDDLIDACWNGRVVGDDAVNRCIAQVRRLAERTGAFTVETIPRVGHRLTVGAPAVPARRSVWWRAAAVAGVVAVALLAAGGAWMLRTRVMTETPVVQVTPLRVLGDGELANIAQELGADIAGVLNENGVQTSLSPLATGDAASRADLRLSGAVRRRADQLYVRLFLEDPQAGLTLWSREFQSSVSDADRLRDAAASAAAETIYTALEPTQQKGLKLEPEVLALHIGGSEIVKSPELLREGEARRIFEVITQRAPGFAGGHAVLAVALAAEARQAVGAERATLMTRAREAARTAIRIDPYAAGAAYDARFMLARLERPRALAAAEDEILEGLRRSPEYPFLSMRECRILTEVGRAVEAQPHCRRALALRPFAGPIGHSYARAVYVAGEPALAQQAIERAARRNPDHANVRQTRFELAALSGSPGEARALLRDPSTSPQFIPPASYPALDAFLSARESGRESDADAAARLLMAAGETGEAPISLAVRALAVLGRTDMAFALMAQPRFDLAVDAQNAGFLMEPSMAAIRRDPRFWPIAARVGLVSYWTARQRWPDFCGSEMELAACQAAAATAMRGVVATPGPSARPPLTGVHPMATREMRGFAR